MSFTPPLEPLLACIPNETSSQTSAVQVAEQFIQAHHGKSLKILDLGCGTGASKMFFQKIDDSIQWTGIDIEDSPEVRERLSQGDEFITYDGVSIPLADNEYDIVYSHQVFEHIRYPEKVLQEILRVLKPQGMFIGSTSNLEPYHSYSFWNFTPYGFVTLLQDAGFTPTSIRPGLDGPTLILRQLSNRKLFLKRWIKQESPLNRLIEIVGFLARWSAKRKNALKLHFCGHFVFIATKA